MASELLETISAIAGLSFDEQRARLRDMERRGVMLGSDSVDYDQLVTAVWASSRVDGIICEIGVREGGSSQVIMRALEQTGRRGQAVLAIDPYGHIPYVQSETETHRNDYTNMMRNLALSRLYAIAYETATNYVHLNLEDTEFFERFAGGFPVYDMEKAVVNTYRLVHFDGPHSLETTRREALFFMPRTAPGSCFVFDNVEGYYDHQPLRELLLESGWRLLRYTRDKATYQRPPLE